MHSPAQRRRRRAHPRSVRVVGAAWAQQLSGMVTTGNYGSVKLIQGEPQDLHSLETLTLALEDPQLDFRKGEVYGRPGTPRLGTALWNAASTVARPKKLGPRSQLLPRMDLRRLQAFPLCNATRKLLRDAQDGALPLGGLIRMDKSLRQDVLRELATLVAMGVFDTEKLDKPRRPQPKAPTNRHHVEAIYSGSIAPRPIEHESDPALVRRMRRELELLREADDFTVLGLSSRASAEAIDEAARRMVSRFEAVVHAPDTGEPARSMAQRVLDQVVASAERARSGKARRQTQDLNPAMALDEGKAQIQRGDFTTAAKCFAVARNHEPFNAHNVAWLGWAVFNDPSRDLTARRLRGRKLLDEAQGLGGADGDAGFLHARADILEGDLVRAWSRLEEVVKAWPKNKEARALLLQVQKDVKKA